MLLGSQNTVKKATLSTNASSYQQKPRFPLLLLVLTVNPYKFVKALKCLSTINLIKL